MRLGRTQGEPLGDGLRARGRGIRHPHEHGRCREPAPQVAGDAPRQRGIAGEERLHEARAQQRVGARQALMLLEGEARHRDDRRHDTAALLVELAGGDRDDAAEVAAAAERLHREGSAVDAQRRSRARTAAEHPADLGR